MKNSKGSMYPIKVSGNLIGWIFLFGLVGYLVKKNVKEKIDNI